MLVLSRKLGESIVIDDVTITVVKVDRNRVRIGIEAPHDRKILRGELVDAHLEFELPGVSLTGVESTAESAVESAATC